MEHFPFGEDGELCSDLGISYQLLKVKDRIFLEIYKILKMFFMIFLKNFGNYLLITEPLNLFL